MDISPVAAAVGSVAILALGVAALLGYAADMRFYLIAVPVIMAAILLVLFTATLSDAACERYAVLTAAPDRVIDGDTLIVAGTRIRLQGISAPETHEPGGHEATAAMRALVTGRTLRCELDGTRTYDRCVAICYLDGADIAASLVRQGLARDCERFSAGRYAADEERAVAAGAAIRETHPLPGYCR